MPTAAEAELYALMRRLDQLEELREDLLEVALRGGTATDEVEDDLDEAVIQQTMAALEVRSLADVDRRIAELNARVDEYESHEA